MTHKTIDISEDVYKKITDLKQEEESISNFILRLINEKKINSNEDLESNIEDWEKIEKILYEDRLKSNASRDIEL
ncbi:MAG: antitoxin VapB family protein [Candidatus Lokiarchaeota archaeon]|nr:antitoxin VapB family protein [Candidatus Lokiarchaeota archaeon]